MLPLILGTALNPLNSTMLSTALNTISADFNRSIGEGVVLIMVLYITSVIFQPLMGRLSDVFGAKLIFLIGLGCSFAAGIIGGLAPDFNWLIASRVILGIGTSANYPAALAVLKKSYAAKNMEVPGEALSIITIASQVSMVLGPALGGYLTTYLGWNSIFYINVPWAALTWILAAYIPSDRVRIEGGLYEKMRRIDIIGVVLFASLVLVFVKLLDVSRPSVLLFIVLLVFGLAFVLWELRRPDPFIQVRVLVAQPLLTFAFLRTALTNYILYIMIYAVPQWLQAVKNLGADDTGLIMIPFSITSIAIVLAVGNSRRLLRQMIFGVGLMAASGFSIFLLNQSVSMSTIHAITLVMGAAMGVNLINNQAILNREADDAHAGISFGLYRTFGQLGALLSGTHLSHLFMEGVTDERFRTLGYVSLAATLGLALLIIPWYMEKLKRSKRQKAARP